MRALHVFTYNIHKGFPQFRRRLALHELRERLHSLEPDLVFLQEVVGLHQELARQHADWPSAPQHEFLAGEVWPEVAYGRNVAHDGRHHGNAILSKFPILRWDNEDISMHRLEGRGLLHCELQVPGWDQPLHAVNVHLGLFAVWRARQLDALVQRIERLVPPQAPLVIAGDFNDWSRKASRHLGEALGASEVFELLGRVPARSFPASLPLLHLDRIYVRGLRVKLAYTHGGLHWSRLSDHLALSALVSPLGAGSRPVG